MGRAEPLNTHHIKLFVMERVVGLKDEVDAEVALDLFEDRIACSVQRRVDDRMDAQLLARLARVDPALLYPIRHRGQQAQQHRTHMRHDTRTAHGDPQTPRPRRRLHAGSASLVEKPVDVAITSFPYSRGTSVYLHAETRPKTRSP